LVEMSRKANSTRPSELAGDPGKVGVEFPTREDIARVAEISVRSGSTQRDIVQAMGGDQATLNSCINRHLGLKWKTAWK
jgi:hypothetical protein